jgi:hypothetical protein
VHWGEPLHLRYHCRGCNRVFVEESLDGILARALTHHDPSAAPAEPGDDWRMVLWAELPPLAASDASDDGGLATPACDRSREAIIPATEPPAAEREGTSIHG